MTQVLIVDDEPSVREPLAEFLTQAGYGVQTAEDAGAALDLLAQRSFDVVVTDIILPRVTGVELLQKIHAQLEDVQVIMMTGEPTVETAAEAVRAGAADYLAKPVRKDTLLRVVERTARLKALIDEKRGLEAANRQYQEQLELLVEERTRALRQALEEAQRREAQLRKLSRAVDQSPVSIVITDVAGNIEFVNPKFTQMTGYLAAEVAGKNPRILKAEDTPPEHYRALWATITAGREWRGEFHNKKKDGELFWESASISPIRDVAGVITHFIGVKEDITEKKQMEAKFLRAQRLESIGALASGISHDLNNILTPILMCAPLLREELPETERHKLASTIETSAGRAVGVIKQLLSFGRGQGGQKVALHVRHLIRELGKMTRETFPRSIQVEELCPPDLWPVLGDSTQLHQVLLNLCINARDAMPQGGRLIFRAENVVLDEHYVSMHPEASAGPFVRLEVTDTGTGIPEAIRERIFDPFFTTKDVNSGTGLGLTTVLGIVKNHHGCMSFTSAPGQGTTFEIHLPAQPDAEALLESEQARTTMPRAHGELVLVVEDELVIREAAARTLRQHGYEVVQAADGIEALGEHAAHLPELRVVVTDLLMPLMDGTTLCRILRRLSPHVPIIVSTGGAGGPAGQETLHVLSELGITSLLQKPHNAEALLKAVHEALHE